jgi:N-acyl-D-amino-acid deacylase
VPEFDLIIRGGLIVDGSGGDPFQGDVGITGSAITGVGRLTGTAKRSIEADGRIVTPGFIDIHTHYDGQATWEDTLEPSSGHGVTTVVMGNCGVGFAPCRKEDRDRLVQVMEGVEDIPEIVMSEGIPWEWETYGQFLDFVGARTFDIDCASYLPHAAVRVYVMGDRASAGEEGTGEDLERMAALVEEAVGVGAIGVSTSQNLFHRDSTGKLAPHVKAGRAELHALAKGLRAAGGGVFQMVPNALSQVHGDSDGPSDVLASGVALVRELAEISGRPVHFTLTDNKNVPREHLEILELVEKITADGLTVYPQILPRPFGVLAGLDISIHPFRYHPSYQPLNDLPLAEKVSALRSPEMRARLLAEEPDERFGREMQLMLAFRALDSYRLGDPPRYDLDPSTSLAHEAARRGLSTWELALDWLLERDGKQLLLVPMGNHSKPNLAAVSEMLIHPNTLIGLGDGGAHYGLLCDSSFPTTTLAYWARDREGPDRLQIQDAVRYLSRRNAEAIGLTDRGLLAPGMKADLNVINFDELRLLPPSVRFDLPGGGRRVVQFAAGFDATVASGEVIREHDHATGARPGRLVRGGRA